MPTIPKLIIQTRSQSAHKCLVCHAGPDGQRLKHNLNSLQPQCQQSNASSHMHKPCQTHSISTSHVTTPKCNAKLSGPIPSPPYLPPALTTSDDEDSSTSLINGEQGDDKSDDDVLYWEKMKKDIGKEVNKENCDQEAREWRYPQETI